MAVCVDRHSGWVVAIPTLDKGLTGAKLAKMMVRHHWRPFGIPGIISSDQGSHFVSTWWTTMCSLLGIRQAYSQAYHHQANGRVERAGQQLLELLRKLSAESRVNWVEALPQVVDRLHDVKGEGGLSPYEILFGRERPMAVCVLKVGDQVWYKRPENSGEKLDSRWIGPGVVKAREGKRSYLIKIKPGFEMKAHRSFLKLYNEPQVAGRGVPLFYFKRTEPEEGAMPDEWQVEKILAHRKRGGEWEFFKTCKKLHPPKMWRINPVLHHQENTIRLATRTPQMPMTGIPGFFPQDDPNAFENSTQIFLL